MWLRPSSPADGAPPAGSPGPRCALGSTRRGCPCPVTARGVCSGRAGQACCRGPQRPRPDSQQGPAGPCLPFHVPLRRFPETHGCKLRFTQTRAVGERPRGPQTRRSGEKWAPGRRRDRGPANNHRRCSPGECAGRPVRSGAQSGVGRAQSFGTGQSDVPLTADPGAGTRGQAPRRGVTGQRGARAKGPTGAGRPVFHRPDAGAGRPLPRESSGRGGGRQAQEVVEPGLGAAGTRLGRV